MNLKKELQMSAKRITKLYSRLYYHEKALCRNWFWVVSISVIPWYNKEWN